MSSASSAALAWAGVCPDCGMPGLLAGPEGGASVNFACFACGSRFNGCVDARFASGEVLFFERTGKLREEDRALFSRPLVERIRD